MRHGAGSGIASFPRHARLTDSRSFSRVFAHANRVADSRLTLLYRGRSDSGGARLGLAVSRRVAPRAVDRNRIKRIIRESFRQYRPDLPAVDVVIIARARARQAPREELHGGIARLLRRMQRQCDKD